MIEIDFTTTPIFDIESEFNVLYTILALAF